MRKVEETIEVSIVTYGGGVIKVELTAGATVKEAIDEANVTLGASDKVFAGSLEANLSVDEVEDGDILTIVGAKAGGSIQ